MTKRVTDLPLHHGHAPKWLFNRMVKLTASISEYIISDYGCGEFLKRLSNPYFFQALACVAGFDWHSSGTTTTLCGALKCAVKPEWGVKVCGGKGRTSRKTPSELKMDCFKLGDGVDDLIHASRLSAKVDNSLIQDGFQLYHHTFIHDREGSWVVIQQGMNDSYARRYQWFSEDFRNFCLEPGNDISCDKRVNKVLNLTNEVCEEVQDTSVDLINDGPSHLLKYFKMPEHHSVLDFDFNKRELRVLEKACESSPSNYEELISVRGFGAKKIRALALVSKVIHGNELSWKDPVKYSFAHGGKDGFPYPVNKEVYDNSVNFLNKCLNSSNAGSKSKRHALKRLNEF